MSIYIKKVGYQEDLVYDFACDNCHCEWSADADETMIGGSLLDWHCHDEPNRIMACPCCGRTVSTRARSCMKTAMVLRARDDGYLFMNE